MHNSKLELLDRECVVPLLGPAGSEDPALFNGDGQVVDACFSAFHVTLGVEFPQLVSVASPPLASLVMPFVLEPDGYPVILKRPKVFAQCVVLLALPFGGEELDDCGSASDKFRSIPPLAVGRVRRSDPLGVSSVPGVLGSLDLLGRGAFVKWWQGRPVDLGFVAHWFDGGRSFIVVSFCQQSTDCLQRTSSLEVVAQQSYACVVFIVLGYARSDCS